MLYDVSESMSSDTHSTNSLIQATSAAREYWHSHNLDSFSFILLLLGKDKEMNVRIRAAFYKKLSRRTGIAIEGAEVNNLFSIYSLYAFTDKLIIGSFDLPHGRKLRNLLDSGIATEDELINDVILGAM
jgi:hypothetical protein